MMQVTQPRWIFIALAILAAFLTACSHYENYAPVFTNNPDNTNTLKEILTSRPPSGRLSGQQVVRPIINKSKPENDQVVKSGKAPYAAEVSSGQNSPEKNNVAVPYATKPVQKIRSANPDTKTVAEKQQKNVKNIDIVQKKITILNSGKAAQFTIKSALKQQQVENSGVKKVKNNQKSSIISIDNKKMLKLNFQWPVRGKVLKNFSQTHNKGIDIAGNIGQAIAATCSGKVAYSGQGLVGFGKLLIIKHNDQYLSAYANVDQIEVGEGQQVEKGRLIAKIGRTGSKKTSLHFEIRKNGKPVNPLKYLP